MTVRFDPTWQPLGRDALTGAPLYWRRNTVLDTGFTTPQAKHQVGDHRECGVTCPASGTDMREGLCIGKQLAVETISEIAELTKRLQRVKTWREFMELPGARSLGLNVKRDRLSTARVTYLRTLKQVLPMHLYLDMAEEV